MSDFQSRNWAGSSDIRSEMSELVTELEWYTAEIGHWEQLCDTGLAFWQDEHRQNSFAILVLAALDLVILLHRLRDKRTRDTRFWLRRSVHRRVNEWTLTQNSVFFCKWTN